MPATEQIWRDTKLLHVVFGLSALAMLGTTVWMLAADHTREWKDYQRKFRDLEVWTTASRINEEQTQEFVRHSQELSAALQKAQAKPPSREQVASFVAEAQKRAEANRYDMAAVDSADRSLLEATQPVAGASQPVGTAGAPQAEREDRILARRAALIRALSAVVTRAKFDEDNRSRTLKFRRADLDSELSFYYLGIDEGASVEELAKLQEKVDAVRQDVLRLTLEFQDAKTHRLALEKVLAAINAPVEAARKGLADHESSLEKLHKVLVEQEPNWFKTLLQMPILDGFGRQVEKVDQIWLPKLTFNNNFRDVARFDRCTTCHLAIDKTAPGAATDPGYDLRSPEPLVLRLETPAAQPELKKDSQGNPIPLSVRELYGMELAEQGLVNPNEITIDVVWPETPAARARLKAGDVIEWINDVKILDKERALTYLVDRITWGLPLELKIRRGVPHPYASHPRLDLFVGSLSPHKMGDMGCTICHDGQGSGTSFKWSSHTPNTPREMQEWARDHGWFNNHYWLFPMQPERFRESTCLKCHHNVMELEPSPRFPDPPAPKLVQGFNLIRQNGCFGCHEINGWDGPNKRVGPDLRAEPAYTAAAAELLIDPALTADETRLAHQVIQHPENEQPRKLLAEALRADGAKATAGNAAEPPRFAADSRKLADILGADDPTPGQYRKVGPSLRHLKSKVDLAFVYDWIREPGHFRPTTRMPRFFGLYDHFVPVEKLDAQGRPVLDEHGQPIMEESPGLKESQRFEPIEIRAVAEYLLNSSQKFEYREPAAGVTEAASAERGKLLFHTRGCLACHSHQDFPEGKAAQGPDLSRIGSKLTTADGGKWLYTWLKNPSEYHPRTLMPVTFLDPITGPEGKVTDPAADIAAFLLATRDWQPRPMPDGVDRAAVDALAKIYLNAAFTEKQSQRYLAAGIPESLAGEIKGDELELVSRGEMSSADLEHKKLLYLGRKTIGRLGCSGCHDIPGFEAAKPIGTTLADWGRKDTSKLAFEQIVEFLTEKHAGQSHATQTGSSSGHGLDPEEMDPDTGYYIEAILHHQREGFLWQKLREPRSYDYKKTENKPYTDRLRMPKFNFDDAQREAVVTFVLGLVAEPPTSQYVYHPPPRQKAIQEGKQLLEKYNCVGCHTLEMETWEFDYDPKKFQDPAPFNDFAFLQPHFTPEQLAASKKIDRRGLGHAVVTGMPNPEVAEDDDGNPVNFFTIWKSTVINGRPWVVGDQDVDILIKNITDKRDPVGGDFARLLHPVALALEQQANPNAKASDAWGWVPPPLVGEGHKVQSEWLHDFLLDPFPIRPATILRMPKFNMSSDEASKLADYFPAADDAEYPYEFDPRTRTDYLEATDRQHPGRLNDALRIVTDRQFCVLCHKVGDFTPEGRAAALAPNLDRIYERLRPDYLQRWLARPKRLLPYTGMPDNFKLDTPLDLKLYNGTSEEQLQAVADLLLNYDAFAKSRFSVKPLVPPAPPAPLVPTAPPANAAGGN